MHTASSHSRPRSLADAALSGALRHSGAARQEQLVGLSMRYPDHAPVWVALAEEHMASRRLEEARKCAGHALALDPDAGRDFSSVLAGACASLLSSARAPRSAFERQQARSMQHAIHHPGEADIELGQAKLLSGSRLARRLEELSRRFDDHAPTWIALAESYLAQRRVELAVAAVDTALGLDPDQARFMSPKLDTAYRYHSAESASVPAPQQASQSFAPASGAFDSHGASFGDLPAIDLPDVGTAQPTDRTQYVANPLLAKPARPLSRPMPAYLRDWESEPTLAVGRSKRDPNIDALLNQALDVPQRTQRLHALRELNALAPDHASVLFNLAMQLVMADQYDEARWIGDQLQELDLARFRQLYDWAEDWVRTVRPHTGPLMAQDEVADPYSLINASMQPDPEPLMSAKLRPMQYMGLPSDTPASVPAGRPQVYKTQLLALPVPPLRRTPRATPPSVLSRPRTSATAHTAAPAPTSNLRTAGALIAGICAGLIVAMMLVFAINSARADDSNETKKPAPRLIEKSADSEASVDMRPDRAPVAHSATAAARTL